MGEHERQYNQAVQFASHSNSSSEEEDYMAHIVVLSGDSNGVLNIKCTDDTEKQVWIISPYNSDSNNLPDAEVCQAIQCYLGDNKKVEPKHPRMLASKNRLINRFIRESERCIR